MNVMEKSSYLCISINYNDITVLSNDISLTIEKSKINNSNLEDSKTLDKIAEDFFGINLLKSVRSIKIIGNKFNDKLEDLELPIYFNIFPKLNSLKILGLNSKHILHVLKNFDANSQNIKLGNLDISTNNICEIEPFTEYIVHVESLDISYNNLSFVPPQLFSKLKKLNVSCNNLCQLSDLNFSNFSNLRTLVISNNHLQSLKGIEKLTSLFELNASDNFITNFTEISYLGPLKFLTRLNLYGNPIYLMKNYRLLVSSKMSPVPRIDSVYLDWVKMNTTELARMGIDSTIEFTPSFVQNTAVISTEDIVQIITNKHIQPLKNSYSTDNNILSLDGSSIKKDYENEVISNEHNIVSSTEYFDSNSGQNGETTMIVVENPDSGLLGVKYSSTPKISDENEMVQQSLVHRSIEDIVEFQSLDIDETNENDILQVNLLYPNFTSQDIYFIRISSWHLFELSINGIVVNDLDLRYLKQYKSIQYSNYKELNKDNKIAIKENNEDDSKIANNLVIILNFDMVNPIKMTRHYMVTDETSALNDFANYFQRFVTNYWDEKDKSIKYTCLKCDIEFSSIENKYKKEICCPQCSDFNVIIYSESKDDLECQQKLPSINSSENLNYNHNEMNNEQISIFHDLIDDNRIDWCDHRLKLHISLNIFIKSEESIACLLKCWRINMKNQQLILSLLIVSNCRIYITHVNRKSNDISKLLNLHSHHSLGSIKNTIIGASSQSIIIEANRNDNYKFLICDSEKCEKFVQILSDASQWVVATDGRGRNNMTINRFRLIDAKNFRNLIESVDSCNVNVIINEENIPRFGFSVDNMAPLYYRVVWHIDDNNDDPNLISLVMSRQTIIKATELHNSEYKANEELSSSFSKIFANSLPICCPLVPIEYHSVVDIVDVITYEGMKNSLTIRFCKSSTPIDKEFIKSSSYSNNNNSTLDFEDNNLICWSILSDSTNSIEFMLSIIKVIWNEWMKIDLKHIHFPLSDQKESLITGEVIKNSLTLKKIQTKLCKAQSVRWK